MVQACQCMCLTTSTYKARLCPLTRTPSGYVCRANDRCWLKDGPYPDSGQSDWRKTAPVPTSGLWHHLSAVPPTGPRPTALFLILGTASLTVVHCRKKTIAGRYPSLIHAAWSPVRGYFWSPVRGYFVTTDEVPRTAQASGFRTPGDSKRPSVGDHPTNSAVLSLAIGS